MEKKPELHMHYVCPFPHIHYFIFFLFIFHVKSTWMGDDWVRSSRWYKNVLIRRLIWILYPWGSISMIPDLHVFWSNTQGNETYTDTYHHSCWAFFTSNGTTNLQYEGRSIDNRPLIISSWFMMSVHRSFNSPYLLMQLAYYVTNVRS